MSEEANQNDLDVQQQKEEYKQIENFEDYFISNLGNVKRIKDNKEKKVNQCKRKEYLGFSIKKRD